jgi:hypothetical protein
MLQTTVRNKWRPKEAADLFGRSPELLQERTCTVLIGRTLDTARERGR